MTVDYIGFAYAATVAVGGVIGYLKAGSVPSLGAGVAFGAILAFGAYQVTTDCKKIYLSLGTSVVLGGLMSYRYYTTQKFMPAGLIAIISFVMVAKLGFQGVQNFVEAQKTH